MAGWILFGAIVLAVVTGLVLLFRSLRRWRQAPPKTADQIQAEMKLYAASRQVDRW